MNNHLQSMFNVIQNSTHLSDVEKESLIKLIQETGKAQKLTQLKLDRFERDRHNLTVRLEESIEELRKKSKAIEEQSRELKIESALERVRTVALGMKKPADMLEICKTISLQLQSFNVKEIRNVQTAIFYEDKGTYMNYEYYAKHDKTFITETTYTNNAIHNAFANQMLKGNGEFFVTHIKDDEVKDWIAYQKTTNVFIDDYLNTASSLNYYWYSLGPVALGISTYEPLKEEDINLFKRFLKVFELSYTRYLDIEQAIAQAREAQIQLSLERVRARTMAMQKSDELNDVAALLFQQVKELGIKTWTTGFNVWSDDNNFYTDYVTTPQGNVVQSYTINANKFSVFAEVSDAKKRGEKFWIQYLEGDLLKEAYKQLTTFNNEEQYKKILQDGFQFPSHQYDHFVFGSKISLMFITYEAVPEAHDIFKRFGQVFEQAYTRFLDLQKAEGQAREAQIQLALERVRAGTMAMQKSDELKEVIQLVYEQFVQLKINVEHTGFIIDYKARDDMHIWLADQHEVPFEVTIPYFDCAHWNSFLEAKEKGKDFFANHLDFDEKNKFYQDLFKLFPVPDEAKEYYLTCSGLAISTALLDNVGLYIENFSGIPYSDEENKTLMRFGKVFQQTYTRFLDLQKAEAQAREAQIEAALERVRARTMAMHKSSELIETAELLFDQLKQLGAELQGVAFAICDENSVMVEKWTSIGVFSHPYTIEPGEERMYEAWKNGEVYYEEVYEGERQKKYYEAFMEIPAFKQGLQKFIDSGQPIPKWQKNHAVTFKYGYLLFITTKPFKETGIFLRFGKVFQQTYTRFLDLQKAEAQAREAEIELALERVRARTMAMHKSDELQEVVHTVFERLKELNIEFYTAIIILFAEGSKDIIWWLENKEKQQYPKILIPYADNAYWRDLLEARESGINHFSKSYFSKEKEALYHHLFEHTDFKHVPEKQKKFLLEAESATISVAIAKNSGIHLTRYSEKAFSEDENEILRRFANVFEQSYTRFLDLQKAEAQAREAQIETALERVRSRTTIMQKSEELRDVIQMVFEQLQQLHFQIDSAHFNVSYKESNDYDLWSAAPGQPYPVKTYIPYFDHPAFVKAKEAKEKGFDFFTEKYTQEEKNKFFEYLFQHVPVISEERKKIILSGPGFAASRVMMDTICLWIMNYTGTPYSDAENAILKRFGKVFEQTYTRFLDLQKAEAQAREAQVEAALERVRAKTMAMQKSDDLSGAIAIVFEELGKMNLETIRCGISIINKENHTTNIWSTTKTDEGTVVQVSGDESMDIHPLLQGAYNAWQQQKDFSYVLKDDDLQNFYKALNKTNFKLPVNQNGLLNDKQYMFVAHFAVGGLYVFKDNEFSEDAKKIIKRFGEVFNLTYTRFKDLQIAEANTKEAIKQAALDRIRADIASMRTVNDLDRITPLIWNELTILGVSFIRCGVFIMDESKRLIHTFLSTPEGKAIAAFHLPFDTPGNFSQIVNHWRSKKIYVSHWTENDFTSISEILARQGAIETKEQYLLTLPHEGFYLHFLPFLQGMLYVGNTTRLGEEEIKLIRSVANAFSTAYARYEDFNKLEAAKQQIEKTLVELKQAQQQLIQSEKMASLGELTAGIAHEIQNPLNFVNNFSEVNREMVDEVIEEIYKGNYDEVKNILNDIKGNSEKINHHGKRAEGIVKGMLQHSRASTGKKESTDINALADEYLRLSYHGMRAKDKSFNAEIKTDFDDSIEKINVVPQDIGRVLLNLFNNAFYAVGERQKVEGVRYAPVISVCTKKLDDKVEIDVKDNGAGIPQNVVDKIFQPFFTTKPTGQGTGLGLSLSYDIIKAHGGEIKVETKEGDGSNFTIKLPFA